MANRKRQAGFTLIEILIVVVILGILAAIVIPQFTQASESARASSLVQQLQTIRSQIELFQIQHNGRYPDLTDAKLGSDHHWGEMTEPHDIAADGSLVANDDGRLGPYLQQAPVNPFMTGDAARQVDATSTDRNVNEGATGVGWTYSPSSGRIKAVFPGTQDEADDLGLTDDDVVVAGGDGT